MNYLIKKFRIPNSEFRILNNSGASLLFVLAVMFLLLAIGTSVLVAAGAGRGAMARQAEHNQLMLLDESIQRNIMHSLQNPENADSLGAQIVWAAWRMYEEGGELGEVLESGIVGIELDIDFDNEDFSDDVNEMIDHIRLIIIQQDVDFNEGSPQYFEELFERDGDGNLILVEGLPIPRPPEDEYDGVTPRFPKTAIVSLTIVVEVKITVGERTITSEAEYLFTAHARGLTDADPDHNCNRNTTCTNYFCAGIFEPDDDEYMRLIEGGGGVWTLERRGVMIGSIRDEED